METKRARGIAKGVVTRKINEITDLMTDENNVDEVNRKINELKEAFEKFQAVHRTFHSELTEREAIEESTSYYDAVFDQVEHLQESADVLLTGIETTRRINSSQVQERPDDSVSNVAHVLSCLEHHAPHARRKRHALRPLVSEQRPQLERPF